MRVGRETVQVGDSIKFKAMTRDSYKTATRKVNGFWSNGCPTVRYQGWSDFVVARHEIISLIKS